MMATRTEENMRRWRWFAPIRTQEDAIRALSDARQVWYLLAGFNVLGVSYSIWQTGHEFEGLFDGGIYFTAGYFLPHNKSRTFAWAMLLFSILAFSGSWSDSGRDVGPALLIGFSY